MKRIYTPLLFVLSLLLVNTDILGQTATIGTGTETPSVTLYSPVYRSSSSSSFDYSRSNILYTASELTTAGITSGAVISQIAFFKVGPGATNGDASFSIYMANSSTTAPLSSSTTWVDIQTSHTQVYSTNTQSIPAAPGWVIFTLSNPFTYLGGSLEMAFDWDISGVSGSPTTDGFDWQYTNGFENYIIGNAGSSVTTTMNGTVTAYINRPNIQIQYTPGSPCTSPPTAGSAMASKTTVCSGEAVQLSLSGNSTGSGQKYQWQKSASSTGPWTNIDTSRTSSVYTVNPTATAYYRAKVKCTDSTYSTSIVINVNAFVSGTFKINNVLPTGGINFQSFADAINHIRCGINGPVVLNVEPGTGPYTEQIVIPEINGASATNTITINGNLSQIQFETNSSTERHIILLDGADYVTIKKLRLYFMNAPTYGWGVHLTNGANYNKIDSCTINMSEITSTGSSNSGGIVGSGSNTSVFTDGSASYNTISNNNITGGYQGIIMNAGSGNVGGTKNMITKNVISDFYANGMEFTEQDSATISFNNISRMSRAAVTTFAGIEMGAGNQNCMINGNRIHDTHNAASSQSGAAYGIYSTGNDAPTGMANRFTNNLIYNFNSGTGTQYGIYNSSSDGTHYYHNTIALDNGGSTSGITRGFYQTTTADNIEFRNNIVYIARGGTGNKHNLYFNATASTIMSNNNVLYNMSPSGTNEIGYYGGGFATLIDWQGANTNAYDQLSVSVDPLFVNPGAGIYKPSEPSINDIGANVGVMTDILGIARGASPDPGAYEFSLGSCTNPPTPGNAVVSSMTVCSGADFTLDLANNSFGDNQTYQWQSSPNNSTWTNIGTDETTTSYQTSQTANTYYRAKVVCGAGAPVYSTSVLVTSPALISGTFIINNVLPTGGNNFASFADALNHISCGINGPVVFNVEPGTGPYNEQVVIPEISGASATNTVTFNGNLSTIQFETSSSSDRHIIKLDGADHIILKKLNLYFQNAPTYGWGIHLTNGANYNKIDSNTINMSEITSTGSSNSGGIIGSGSNTSVFTDGDASYNTISNNTITGGYQGIILNASTGNVGGTKNVITKNMVRDFYAVGIEITEQDSATISYNNISRMGRSAVTTFAGIELGAGNQNSMVNANRIHDTHNAATSQSGLAYGIYSTGDDAPTGMENRFTNNLIYNFNSGTGTQYAIYNSSSDGAYYFHNTLVLDNGGSTSGTTRGFYQTTTADNIQFKNNIVYITRGGSGTKYNLYFNSTASTIESNNNLLYNMAPSGTNEIGYYSGGFATLTDWKGANSNAYDQQSISLDPGFVNPGAGNYTPTSSLADNKGMPQGVLKDILDSMRSSITPDIGAYEFSTLTAGINMSAQGLITPAMAANGCYTNAETVTIRIRNSSTSTHNFATNPVTVTTNVTGAVTQTLTATINTGTLASDASMNVPMTGTLNMSIQGVYTFNANTTLAGDVNTANDAMLPTERTKVALTVGTASGPSGYCVSNPVNPTLSTTNHNGYSALQWLQSTMQTGVYTVISGTDTVPYKVATAPTQTMYYKLVATCGTVKDTSTVITVNYNNPMVISTAPASRCGSGSVTLGATGSNGAMLEWYSAATGGSLLTTGTSYTTPTLTADTTFYYVAANIAGGSGGASPLMITEVDLGAPDQLEIQNVSPAPVDVTGWKVSLSDSYTDITSVNPNIQTLNGVMNPGQTISWTDVSSDPNYWGSNMFWNPGSPAWVIIQDNNNNLVDVVFINWSSSDIQNASITIGTSTVSIGSQWSGDGVTAATVASTESVSRQGNMDNNNSSDFAIINLSMNSTNPGMTVPFLGFGCSSARTAVMARTNDCPLPITLLSFTGEKQGSINKLQWTTSTEVNNAGFELERSADGRNFSKLIFVNSLGDNGNSNRNLTYNYNDERPLASNGYYRLKQVDKDGRFSYSNIVLIKGTRVTDVLITSLYPNPTVDEINLVISSPSKEKVTLMITDITGKVLHQQKMQIVIGDNLQQVQVSQLARGTYFIKTICENGCNSPVMKFVKQ